MVKLYREKIQIIRDILESCESDARISHISRKAHLTTDKVHEFVDFLIERNLIEQIEKKHKKIDWPKNKSNTFIIYKITPEGLELRKMIDYVMGALND